MGKKGTKKKTTWRTLSISETVAEDVAASRKNGSFSSEQNRQQASIKDDRFINSSYLRRKPLYNSLSNNDNNNHRTEYSRNYYKQNSALSTTSSTSTTTTYSSRQSSSYYRRSYQNSATRFFNFRSGRSNNNNNNYYNNYNNFNNGTSHGNRTSETNKENNQTKPLFNEEEYTRITTPRQDVIFKKGYLSQPRKYLSSTDTNTTSSAAASIVSTEESFSATSVPSLSPEQCSSYADSIDPEQAAFMYSSYVDQNGVFYINPYMPNGFDQYTGQMFMLPYSYQPYNVYPSELNSPMPSTDVEENAVSTDSNDENVSDKETNIKEKVEEISISSCDSKPEEDQLSKSEETIVNPEKDEEIGKNENTTTKENVEQTENMNTSFENLYNYGYQQFYPPVFFPYVYGQQFMPFMGTECEPFIENENAVKYKRRDRTSTSVDGNSIGATNTDDCSEEEEDCNDDDVENDENTAVEKESCDTVIELKSENNQETEKKIIFNANAEEFIPRIRKSHLNVNVKEFLPNTSKLKEENDVTTDSTNSLEREEITPESDYNNSSNHKESKELLSIKNASFESNTKENATTSSTLQQRNESEKPILTLAERIKRGLTESSANKETSSNLEKSSPLKNNILTANNNNNNNNKKSSNSKRNNDIKKNLNEKSSISFAQILAKNNKKAKKSASSPNSTVVSNNNGNNNNNKNYANANEKYSAKNTAKKNNLNLDLQQEKASAIDLEQQQQQQSKISNIHKENTAIIAAEKIPIQDEWQTVKSKGKRKHFKEIVFTDEVEPEPEQKESNTTKINAEAQQSPIIKDTTITKEKVKCPEDDEKKVVELLVINNSSKEPLEKGKECEEISTTVDPVIDDHHPTKLTELENSQKRIKTRNKRSAKKGQNSVKKIIAKDSDFDVMETINRSNQKTEPKRKIYSKSDEESTSRKSLLFSQHNNNNNNNNNNSEDDDLTLDGLYLVDRKNCLLAQNFCRNPLEILNGFDCKFKGSNNNSILKEEEEMVLNVIKSLSTNQLKQFETAKTANINTKQFENEITSNHGDIKTSFSLEDKKKSEEIECSHHKEINVKNSNENLSNGHVTSCELLSENHVDEDQEEDFEEDTIIQTLTEVVDNSVNGKLVSDTESVSDLSSEDFEKMTDAIVLQKTETLTSNEQIVESALNDIIDVSMEISEDPPISKDVECIQHENNCNNKMYESSNEEEEHKIIDDININVDISLTIAQVSVETSNSYLNDEKVEDGFNQEEAESNRHLMETEKKEVTHPTESVAEKLEENIEENICSFTDCESVQNLEESRNENNTIVDEVLVQESSKEISEENFHSETLLKDTSKDEKFSVESSEKEIIFEYLYKVHDNSSEDQGICIEQNEDDLNNSVTYEEISNHQLQNSVLPNKLHQNEEIIENLQREESILVTNNEEVETSCKEDNFNTVASDNCCSNNEENSIYPQIQNDSLNIIEPLLISLQENLMENINNTERLSSTVSPHSNLISNNNNITVTENLQVTIPSIDNINMQLENINTKDSSKLFSLTETKDNSKETFIKYDNNSYTLDYNDSMVTNKIEPPPTITSEDIDDNPEKFPLTTAIKIWLNNEVKENSPEQIFRIPEDPKLNSVIKNSIIIKKGGYKKDNNNDDYDDDYDDDDVEDVEDDNFTSDDNDHNDKENGKRKLNLIRKKSLKRPKNLKSNPSHVSSVKSKSLSIYNKQIDEQQNNDNNDSDYNSDNQLRYEDDDDDNTCERVAATFDDDVYETTIMTTEEIHKTIKCDLLDYWDDEFIHNPKKWLDVQKNNISRCPSEGKESMLNINSSSTPPTEQLLLAPYESVYGKSIDYKRLLANNYEFLSNNIISFNNNNNNDKISPNDNRDDDDNDDDDHDDDDDDDDNDNDDDNNDQNDAAVVVNINKSSHFNGGNNNNNNNNAKNNEENHIKIMSTNDAIIFKRRNHHEHNYNNLNHNHNLVSNNNIKNNNGNDNCLKPPEVCCIIM